MHHTHTFDESKPTATDFTSFIWEALSPLLENGENIHHLLPIPAKEKHVLIFTDLRIIYLITTEFLEKGRFYSYPYETVKSLIIHERTSRRSDSEEVLWFLIDYTSNEIIFVELFPSEAINDVKELMYQLPAFGDIPMTQQVVGRRRFNAFINDPAMALDNKAKRNLAVVLIAILLVVVLVARSL